MRQPTRIAIDGPAGSGKSTVGERLAHKLGYIYIDTGAMYRAIAWLALQKQISITDGAGLEHITRQAKLEISRPTVNDGRQYTVTLNGQDITWDIRSSEVTRAVSLVSIHPEVRTQLIAQQRIMAQQERGVVMVGRDIGMIVLPDSELKIYLTASLEERARRRHAEIEGRLASGTQAPALQTIIEDIRRRDAIDHGNMSPAEDAIIVTTDNLNVDEVLEVICSYLEDSL